MPGFKGGQGFGLRHRRFQLRQDGLQRIEPRCVEKGVVFDRVLQVGDERTGLVIGEVEGHNCMI
jgi:hypothetical protein